MPTPGAQVKFLSGLKQDYILLASKDSNTLYFCTDTQQIYLGSDEYSKSVEVLSAAPTESTKGDIGKLYAYNGNLYLCTAASSGTYTYVRVANVNDSVGSVSSITVGDGLAQASGDANPITSTGTIKHAVPTGASTHSSSAPAASTLSFGGTFDVETLDTDAFGHVTGFHTTTFTLPEVSEGLTYTLSSTVDGELLLNPDYEREQEEKELERINNLTMTALDFIGVLEHFGLNYVTQIKPFLEAHQDLDKQLKYCQNVWCGVAKQIFAEPIKIGEITITSEMVEQAFRVKNDENDEN